VFLKADALKGVRIGIPRAGIYSAREFPGKARPFSGLKADELAAMEGAIAALRAAGAEIVDPADLPSMTATSRADNLTSHPICEAAPSGPAYEELCSHVLQYTMKRDFNLWLDSLDPTAPVTSLSELRAWNAANRDRGAMRYGQGRLDFADAADLARDKARYEADRQNDLRLTRPGPRRCAQCPKLDALLFS
jgi:amidase